MRRWLKTNKNKQYSPHKKARVTGFADEVDKNCAAKFVTLCREKIGLDISDDIVDRVHDHLFWRKQLSQQICLNKK